MREKGEREAAEAIEGSGPASGPSNKPHNDQQRDDRRG